MQLREGEVIKRVYHHHPTPFVFQVIKAILATLPFFLIVFWFQEAMTTTQYFLANFVIFLIFAALMTYLSLIYWLDKLVITNLRVVHIDWKYLTVRDEQEALLNDIQDIKTHEMGLLSFFRFLDYGRIKIDTASSHVTLEFIDAPDPEGIRRYIYHIRNS